MRFVGDNRTRYDAAQLKQFVACAAGSKRLARLKSVRTHEKKRVGMKIVRAGFGDDIDDVSGSAPEFRRNRICDNGELLNRRQRNVGKNRLSAPRIVARAAVQTESRLAATCAVDDEQKIIQKQIAGSASRAHRRI